MIVDFKTMPDDSRIWIYQSNRDFNESEIGVINDKTISFLDNWQAHGKDLECSYSIIDKRFIIIAVNESVNPIGGCSIDFSLQLIKDGYFSPETIIFNTAINSKYELLNNFEIDISSSWLSKFI